MTLKSMVADYGLDECKVPGTNDGLDDCFFH
jgi:hypothetical protein